MRIQAPIESVWKASQEDLAQVPRWTRNVTRAEVVGGGPPRQGAVVAYHLVLPGGRQEVLQMELDTLSPPRQAAGRFVGSLLTGTWSYDYREEQGATLVTYRADYRLKGALGLIGGLLHSQYERGVRENLESLRDHLESRP